MQHCVLMAQGSSAGALTRLRLAFQTWISDGNPIVGESAYLRNYFIAAGMNSLGILSGGGIGQVLAQWMKHGRPPSDCDVTAINANRFHSFQSNLEYRRQRTTETLGNTYRIHFPNHQPKTCRNAKRSALHDRLKNAHFRDVSGWESPAWYAPPGSKPISLRESFGRENWFPFWEAEHKSCRENVVLFDMSFMSKFLVQGRDAGAFLNRLSTANVDGNAMMITYTQWLDEKGYIQADLTVIKVNEHEFMVIATDTMHNQVYDHMVRRLHHSVRICFKGCEPK
jgi:4-methylaminobutanoate oxidase (formaldehyde-forming)